MRAACTSSRISAEPAWPLTTFFTGQPKLMSMMPRAAIGIELRRLGHDLRLAAGELHRHRLLVGAALAPSSATAGSRGSSPGWRSSRRRPARRPALDQPAERQVGHPRHRRQDDRVVDPDRSDIYAHVLGNSLYCCHFVQAIMGFENTASAKNADETITSRQLCSGYVRLWDYFVLKYVQEIKKNVRDEFYARIAQSEQKRGSSTKRAALPAAHTGCRVGQPAVPQ